MPYHAIDGWIYQDGVWEEPRYAVCRISDENTMSADQLCALLNRGEAATWNTDMDAAPKGDSDEVIDLDLWIGEIGIMVPLCFWDFDAPMPGWKDDFDRPITGPTAWRHSDKGPGQ